MRVEDLKGPSIALCRGLTLKGTKSESARRSLPIHSSALSIYLRRAEGKGPEGLHPPRATHPTRGLSDGEGAEAHQGVREGKGPAGDNREREDGARQGNCDLHGLRSAGSPRLNRLATKRTS